MVRPLVAQKPLLSPPLKKIIFGWRQKTYLAVDALTAFQAEEPTVDETTLTAAVVDETASMTGSKRAASIDNDKKTKVPKKPRGRRSLPKPRSGGAAAPI
jgi:hypothetical protein